MPFRQRRRDGSVGDHPQQLLGRNREPARRGIDGVEPWRRAVQRVVGRLFGRQTCSRTCARGQTMPNVDALLRFLAAAFVVTGDFADIRADQRRPPHLPEGRKLVRIERQSPTSRDPVSRDASSSAAWRSADPDHHRDPDARGARLPRLRRVRDDSSADVRKRRREVQSALRNHPHRSVARHRRRSVRRIHRRSVQARGRRTSPASASRWTAAGSRSTRGSSKTRSTRRPRSRSRTSIATGTIP